ncbi:Hypothetical protein R9X50_00145200 [Acrodontium crateriforme]|uniref:Uncharacterized protein n=1 Tax=Acrodontium crateriforme TaxID=150365 RepID=A0AAQ3LZC5_9PEZI|nr:Hypothetical protein R9X50_00145200 [Acrodontium crateriforme]
MVAVFAILLLAGVALAQSPIICEDTIDGQPPFDNNNIPCILGCGAQLSQPSGSLLPGSVNETAIPYCLLDCVRHNPTPEQSAAAPSCDKKCSQAGNEATPDQRGWCMYWCVLGGKFEQTVTENTCIPELAYIPLASPSYETNGDITVTISDMLGTPTAWQSWYLTQTILTRNGYLPSQGVSSTSPVTSSTITSSSPSEANDESISSDTSSSKAIVTSGPSMASTTTNGNSAASIGDAVSSQSQASLVSTISSGGAEGVKQQNAWGLDYKVFLAFLSLLM